MYKDLIVDIKRENNTVYTNILQQDEKFLTESMTLIEYDNFKICLCHLIEIRQDSFFVLGLDDFLEKENRFIITTSSGISYEFENEDEAIQWVLKCKKAIDKLNEKYRKIYDDVILLNSKTEPIKGMIDINPVNSENNETNEPNINEINIEDLISDPDTFDYDRKSSINDCFLHIKDEINTDTCLHVINFINKYKRYHTE